MVRSLICCNFAGEAGSVSPDEYLTVVAVPWAVLAEAIVWIMHQRLELVTL